MTGERETARDPHELEDGGMVIPIKETCASISPSTLLGSSPPLPIMFSRWPIADLTYITREGEHPSRAMFFPALPTPPPALTFAALAFILGLSSPTLTPILQRLPSQGPINLGRPRVTAVIPDSTHDLPTAFLG